LPLVDKHDEFPTSSDRANPTLQPPPLFPLSYSVCGRFIQFSTLNNLEESRNLTADQNESSTILACPLLAAAAYRSYPHILHPFKQLQT
jgi:hypothetical protein